MEFKNILSRIKNLVVAPANEWIAISESDEQGLKAVNNFAMPLIGLCTAAAFVGDLIMLGFNFEHSLVEGILTFGRCYIGLYLAMFIIQLLAPKFGITQDKNKILTLVTYAASIYFVVEFATKLIPDLFFLKILSLYVAYVVWEGVGPILNINEEQKGTFVVLCSVAILFSPIITNYLLSFLLPNIN